MLPEMRYIESELLPELREGAEARRAKGLEQALMWQSSAVPTPLISVTDEPRRARLPDYDLAEIHYDSEKMFVSGLKGALSTAFADGLALPSLRANMGCGIFNTMFGVKQLVFKDKMPWLQQRRTKAELLAMTPEAFVETDEYRAALEHMRFAKSMLDGTGVEVFPLDLQGPIDTAHLALGDQFFYELYDDPNFVNHLLSLATACIEKGLRDCLEIIKPNGYVAHYNALALPEQMPAKVSEDTTTLLCPEHIAEFALPFTNRFLADVGGGYIHYCGRNDALFDAASEKMPRSLALNLGNTDKHDMPALLRTLASRHMRLYDGVSLANLELWGSASVGEDGFTALVPHVSCTCAEQEKVLEIWRRATKRAGK